MQYLFILLVVVGLVIGVTNAAPAFDSTAYIHGIPWAPRERYAVATAPAGATGPLAGLTIITGGELRGVVLGSIWSLATGSRTWNLMFSGNSATTRSRHAEIIWTNTTGTTIITIYGGTTDGFTPAGINDLHSSTDGVTWTLVSSTVMSGRHSMGYTLCGDLIYIVSGYTSGSIRASTSYAFNVTATSDMSVSANWIVLPSLFTGGPSTSTILGESCGTCRVSDSTATFIGGKTTTVLRPVVLQRSNATAGWVQYTLPTGVASAACGYHNGVVYSLGGYTSGTIPSQVVYTQSSSTTDFTTSALTLPRYPQATGGAVTYPYSLILWPGSNATYVYTEDAWRLESQTCASSPCQNGGTCKEYLETYECTCPAGYSGILCQTDINECASAPCGNGGTCFTNQATNGYVCTCAPGYSGLQCLTDINECVSSPCVNGGTCYTTFSNSYGCTCLPGYSGIQCQTDINECASAPCRNGGTCYTTYTNSYGCTCLPGYSGTQCQTDINECASSPCGNGGTCFTNQATNGYVCTCPAGYSGTQCLTDINECASSPCTNGGTCYTTLTNSYACTCLPGYSGIQCQTDINECASAPCRNGGSCYTTFTNAYGCTCFPGYSGTQCQTDIDECASSPCRNGGSCFTTVANTYVCTCLPGYSGIQCQTDINECASSPCRNGGTCFTNQAVNGYVCTCAPGYSGFQCNTDINECASSPCQNGGTCVTAVPNSYTCTCVPGFTGTYCETDTNECESAPCVNGGTCIDGVNQYTCSCPGVYFGRTCVLTPTSDVWDATAVRTNTAWGNRNGEAYSFVTVTTGEVSRNLLMVSGGSASGVMSTSREYIGTNITTQYTAPWFASAPQQYHTDVYLPGSGSIVRFGGFLDVDQVDPAPFYRLFTGDTGWSVEIGLGGCTGKSTSALHFGLVYSMCGEDDPTLYVYNDDGMTDFVGYPMTSPSVATQRMGMCAVSFNGAFHYTGGTDGVTMSRRNMYQFGPTADSVSEDPDLPIPLAYHACATYHGVHYIIGGQTAPGVYSNRMFYSAGHTDPVFEWDGVVPWSAGSRMPVALVSNFDDRLYLFSTTSAHTDVWAFSGHVCTSSPCLNGGTCFEGGNSYTCSCPGIYYGTTCQRVGCLTSPDPPVVRLISAWHTGALCNNSQVKLFFEVEMTWSGVNLGHTVGAFLPSSFDLITGGCYGWQYISSGYRGCDYTAGTCSQRIAIQTGCVSPTSDGATFQHACLSEALGNISLSGDQSTVHVHFYQTVLDLAMNTSSLVYTPSQAQTVWAEAIATADSDLDARCGEQADVIPITLPVRVYLGDTVALNIQATMGMLSSATTSTIDDLSPTWDGAVSTDFLVAVLMKDVPAGKTYDTHFSLSTIRIGNSTDYYVPSIATLLDEEWDSFYYPREYTDTPPTGWSSVHDSVCGSDDPNCDVFGMPKEAMRRFVRTHPSIVSPAGTIFISAEVRFYIYDEEYSPPPVGLNLMVRTATPSSLHAVITQQLVLIVSAEHLNSTTVTVVVTNDEKGAPVVYTFVTVLALLLLALVITLISLCCWCKPSGYTRVDKESGD